MLPQHSLIPGLLSKLGSAENQQLQAVNFWRGHPQRQNSLCCLEVAVRPQQVFCLWGIRIKAGSLPSVLSKPRYRGSQMLCCLFLHQMTYLSPSPPPRLLPIQRLSPVDKNALFWLLSWVPETVSQCQRGWHNLAVFFFFFKIFQHTIGF